MADTTEELIKFAYRTACQNRPECCQPRKIKMVTWDADDTLWEIKPYGIASNVRGPFKLIDPDTLEAAMESPAPLTYPMEIGKPSKFRRLRKKKPRYSWTPIPWEEEFEEYSSEEEITPEQQPLIALPRMERKPTRIKLLPTTRDALKKIKEKNIPQAIISLNSPGTVKQIIDAFGLKDYFTEIQDTWEPKGVVFNEVTKRAGVCPCDAIFVDNAIGHVEAVSKRCGLALQIGKGKDVEKPVEVLNYMRD